MKHLLIPGLLFLASLQAPAALIAGYKFDETSGTTAADFIRGASGDGTLVNTTGTQWIAGKIGGAVDFDGVNDYIKAAALTSSYTNFSISAWVNIDQNTQWGTIVKSWGDSFHFGLNNTSGQLSNYLNGGNALVDSTATNPLTLDVWHHVAMTYDGNAKAHRLYIDGTLVAESLSTGLPSSMNAGENYLGIGVKVDTTTGNPSGASPGYLDGAIDDLGLWDETLTQGQINTIIANGNNGFSSIPEPSCLSLLGLGTLALLRRRRSA